MRWALKKIDDDINLMAAAHAVTGAPTGPRCRRMRFKRMMIVICNAAMPYARSFSRDSVYWWSPEIEAKHLCTRRHCQRARKKKRRDVENEEFSTE